MFEGAIESVGKFTRPIHFISMTFGKSTVDAGAATIFFVNKEGWALTCKHVVDQIIAADAINQKYTTYRSEFEKLAQKGRREAGKKLLKRYQYNPGDTCQLKVRFIDSVLNLQDVKYIVHPSLDLALIKLNAEKILCEDFPVFPKKSVLNPGKFLCRLGFPFPEFTNFSLDPLTHDIQWTETGQNFCRPRGNRDQSGVIGTNQG
jgi:hypothetical protein